MTPSLVVKMISSAEAMERQTLLIADRHALDPTALGRGTCRELNRLAEGLATFRRALQSEVSMILAGVVAVSVNERRCLESLAAKLTDPAHRSRSWAEIGELLFAQGFADDRGRAFKRDRLILLAIAAADGKRYALGTPSDAPTLATDASDTDARLFDLLNLPREVGGRGGLAPIVRACFDGSIKYGKNWRFATPHDCLTAEIADDSEEGLDEIVLEPSKKQEPETETARQ